MYFRMKVDINLEMPLTPGFPLKLKNGTTKWVDVKCERLPTFCRACGKVGHESKTCAAELMNDTLYGPWLKAENKQMSPMFLENDENCASSRDTFRIRQALTDVSNREPHTPQDSKMRCDRQAPPRS